MKQALSKLFAFLGKALSEDNGNPSGTRLNQFYAQAILVLCIGFGFIWVVIHWENLVILYLTAVISFLLTLAGFKVWQKGKEENEPK